MASLTFRPHDVILVSNEGIPFSFWKEILVKESDYFRAKFSNGMKDSKDTVISLDAKPYILDTVLNILLDPEYDPSILKIDAILFDLYNFADMYSFEEVMKRTMMRIGKLNCSGILLKFVNEFQPTYPTCVDLAEKLYKAYRFGKLGRPIWLEGNSDYYDRCILPKDEKEIFAEDINESIWKEFFYIQTNNSFFIVCSVLFIPDIMTDEMRENCITDHFPIDVNMTRSEEECIYFGLEKIRKEESYPKWALLLDAKISDRFSTKEDEPLQNDEEPVLE